MILFVSDMHFGRGPTAAERDKEAALLDCLQAHEDAVEHLYLIGDVFDGYIEYRHLVPKGFVRFQALLARWTDHGVPVTYLYGNHDPWHRNYFSEELGVTLAGNPLHTTHYTRRLHLAHGDALASTHGLYRWVRPLLRHPLPIRLYQSLLPADLGLGLAQWISRTLHEPDPDPSVVQALQEHARQCVADTDRDTVIMGHSHKSALITWPAGTYLNTGNWYDDRTFARLDSDGLHLCRWNGRRTLDIESDRR